MDHAWLRWARTHSEGRGRSNDGANSNRRKVSCEHFEITYERSAVISSLHATVI